MKKVLIIDDDDAILEVTTMALEMYGFEVLTLANSANLDQQLSTFKPDCVLLDYNIGDNDNGRVLCNLIKNHPSTPDTKILLFSAAVTDAAEFKHKLFNNFDGYVPKPYDLDDLIQKISQ